MEGKGRERQRLVTFHINAIVSLIIKYLEIESGAEGIGRLELPTAKTRPDSIESQSGGLNYNRRVGDVVVITSPVVKSSVGLVYTGAPPRRNRRDLTMLDSRFLPLLLLLHRRWWIW